MKYTGNYNLKKPEGTDIVNIDDLNENADIIDQKLKELEDGVNNAPPNSVNDAAIGSRTPDQSQAPASPGTGTLTQLISWLANRIKTITGKTNWWDAPPTTLQAAKTHMDSAAPHSGHETPAGAQAKADAAETNAKNHANSLVGTLSNLLTTAKNNVVAAINEIFGKVEDVEDDLDSHLADGASHSKIARFVVGTSTAGWTEKDCDYLCDGTNDQEEIIQALNALPASGGEVVILDGTYNITAKINVNKDNVSIRGNGNATILKRMWDSSSTEGVITLTSVEGCRVENVQIDGNKTTYTASHNYGIYLYSSSNNTITGNTCNNNSNNSILIELSSNNTITGNTCNNNNSGIHVRESNNNTITGNTCNNNDNNNGILLYSSSNNTITGNTCNNNSNGIRLDSSTNNMVTGNTCNNNDSNGISLSPSSSDNTVTGNTCNNNNNRGIYLYSSSNNTITGNTCIRGTGTPEDYTTDQHTILLFGTGNDYNLISSNNCMGKAPVVEGGTGNSVFNNKWNESSDFEDLRADVVAHKADNVPYHVRTATVVVAASDSKYKQYADYVCDGTSDRNIILAALDALPTPQGGKVLLLDGNYYMNTSIYYNTVKNIVFSGVGSATKLLFGGSGADYGLQFRPADDTVDISIENLVAERISGDWGPLLHVGNCRTARFANVKVMNNIATTKTGQGIRTFPASKELIIENCLVQNCTGIGIYVYGNNSKVINCTIMNNGVGIAIHGSANNVIIDGCHVSGNTTQISDSGTNTILGANYIEGAI